jgi:protoheme IX farnesyltransferase
MVGNLASDPDSLERAKGLFRWSILYLFGICLLLVFSRWSGAASFDLQVRSVLETMLGGGLGPAA